MTTFDSTHLGSNSSVPSRVDMIFYAVPGIAPGGLCHTSVDFALRREGT